MRWLTLWGNPIKRDLQTTHIPKRRFFIIKERIKSPNKVSVVYIDNILTFKNNILVSIEQSNESNPDAVPQRRDY